MIKKIYPLPTETEFYLQLHVVKSLAHMGEWVESPDEYPEGAYFPNHHKTEDADFYHVGCLFVLEEEVDVTNLSALSVEAALNYAALLNAFVEDKEGRAEFCQTVIVEGTRHILGEILEAVEEIVN